MPKETPCETIRRWAEVCREIEKDGGTVIKQARKQLEFSQRGLGSEIGWSFVHINNVENGHVKTIPIGLIVALDNLQNDSVTC